MKNDPLAVLISKKGDKIPPKIKLPKKALYCHSIGGRPAKYLEGEQIYFLNWNNHFSKSDCKETLEEIRKEQKNSLKWRKEKGFDCEDAEEYGYFRIMF